MCLHLLSLSWVEVVVVVEEHLYFYLTKLLMRQSSKYRLPYSSPRDAL